MKRILIVILTLLIIQTLTSCQNQPENTDIDQPIISDEIPFGDGLDNHLTSQYVLYETQTYFEFDQTIIIDAYFGDTYSHNQKFNYHPNYNDYDINGYPFFIVMDLEDNGQVSFLGVDSSNAKENSCFIINGLSAFYEERFDENQLEEINIDDINFNKGKYKEWYHKQILIELNEPQEGDFGDIALIFGWYYKNSPIELPKNDDGSGCEFYIDYLYYYVGPNGIAFDENSWEYAKRYIGNPQPIIPRYIPNSLIDA